MKAIKPKHQRLLLVAIALAALIAAGLLAGFGLILYVASTNVLLQMITEDRFRGRIMSLYTLLFVGAPNAINASLYSKLSFNFIRDIAPVASISRAPNVMVVHPSVPATDMKELIALSPEEADALAFLETLPGLDVPRTRDADGVTTGLSAGGGDALRRP